MVTIVAPVLSAARAGGPHTDSISGEGLTATTAPTPSKGTGDATGPATGWRVLLDDGFLRDVAPALKELLGLVLALESFGRAHPFLTACNRTLSARCGLTVRALQFQLDKLAERGWVRPVYVGGSERNRAGIILLRRTSSLVPAAITDVQVASVEAALRAHPNGVVPDEAWRSAFPDPRAQPASLDERSRLHSGERSGLRTKKDRPRKKDQEKKDPGRFLSQGERHDADAHRRGHSAGAVEESPFRASLRAARAARAARDAGDAPGSDRSTADLAEALARRDRERGATAGIAEGSRVGPPDPCTCGDPGSGCRCLPSPGAGDHVDDEVLGSDDGDATAPPADGWGPAPHQDPPPAAPPGAAPDARRPAAADWCQLSRPQMDRYLELLKAGSPEAAEAGAIRTSLAPTPAEVRRLGEILGGAIVGPAPGPVAARGGPPGTAGAIVGEVEALARRLAASRDGSSARHFGQALGRALGGREDLGWAAAYARVGEVLAAGRLDVAWFLGLVSLSLRKRCPGAYLWATLGMSPEGRAAHREVEDLIRGRRKRPGRSSPAPA